MPQTIIYLLCGLLSGGLVGWILFKLLSGKSMVAISIYEQLKEEKQRLEVSLATLTAEKNMALSRQQELMSNLGTNEQQIRRLQDQLQTLNTTIVRLEADVLGRQQRLDTQKQDLEEMKSQLEAQFRLLANDILEHKAKTFSEQQDVQLKDLLGPFKTQIAEFKKEFDEKFTQEVREKSTLRTEIAQLLSLNQSISREAVALTEALRGSTKKQGDWGEDILERILEFSGLQKGIHYTVQESSRDEQGKMIRPDLIVKYPDQRHLVIDSKVSLIHYWDYCNATDAVIQRAAMLQMIRSLKTHIDGLQSKAYLQITNTPDFIIMFVPVEAAYITVMQEDHDLWQYAYTRKILLISPTNLIPAMKMISDLWQRDNIHKDAELIADKAVKLYEKLVGFIDNFEAAGKALEQANNKWHEARKQLHTGKGNLLTQGSQLKVLLGRRTGKEMPAPLIEQASEEQDF
jgi:DNA recombination protein RmuC